MRARTFFLCLILCLATFRASAQESYVTFLPERLHLGDTLRVTYNDQDTRAVLRDADELSVEIFAQSWPKKLELAVPMRKQDGRWTAGIPIVFPDTSIALARQFLPYILVRFSSHGLKDVNRGRGWSIIVYNEKDSLNVNTYYQLAQLYMRSGNQEFKVEKNLDLAYELIQQQFKFFPKADFAIPISWRIKLERDFTEETKAEILAEVIAQYEKSKDTIATSYEFLLWLRWAGKTTEADSLQAQAIRKAPKGSVAQIFEAVKSRSNVVFSGGPPPENSCGVAPFSESSAVTAEQTSRFNELLSEGKLAEAWSYFSTLKNPPEYLVLSLSTAFIRNDKFRGQGLEILSGLLEKSFVKDAEGNWSPKDAWSEITNCPTSEQELMYLYADGLLRAKQYKEAVDFCRGLNKSLNGRSIYINHNLLRAYYKMEQYDSVLRFGFESLNKLQATNDMIELLRAAWFKKYHSFTGVEDSLLAVRARLRPQIKRLAASRRIDREAPDGPINVLGGQSMRLSDLRGKVVVMEFWSSWCGSQVKSFPKLEHACARFGNDPRVRIFAVNSLEHVEDSLREKYVLTEAGSRKCAVPFVIDSVFAEIHHLNGMPVTHVIDKNGRIQFVQGPYINKLISEEELAAQIEILLEE